MVHLVAQLSSFRMMYHIPMLAYCRAHAALACTNQAARNSAEVDGYDSSIRSAAAGSSLSRSAGHPTSTLHRPGIAEHRQPTHGAQEGLVGGGRGRALAGEARGSCACQWVHGGAERITLCDSAVGVHRSQCDACSGRPRAPPMCNDVTGRQSSSSLHPALLLVVLSAVTVLCSAAVPAVFRWVAIPLTLPVLLFDWAL
jgi:hypothetical protein